MSLCLLEGDERRQFAGFGGGVNFITQFGIHTMVGGDVVHDCTKRYCLRPRSAASRPCTRKAVVVVSKHTVVSAPAMTMLAISMLISSGSTGVPSEFCIA